MVKKNETQRPELAKSVLIGAHAYGSEGLPILKEILKMSRKELLEVVPSSVYSVKREMKSASRVHDLLTVDVVSAFAVVIQCKTRLSPSELQESLRELESDLYKKYRRTVASLEILFYENLTQMLPNLTLPNPEFHLVPEFVVGAAEIWGDFEHPVLKKSLYSLTTSFSGKSWGEFYTQGKSLLDFKN